MKQNKYGRNRFEKGLQKPRNVTMSDRLVTLAKHIGKGNVSAGVRKALDAHKGEA